MFLGRGVTEAAIQQSEFLQSIAEAPGVAHLPPHVSIPEFMLWEKAVTVQGDLKPEETVTIFKVCLGIFCNGTYVCTM